MDPFAYLDSLGQFNIKPGLSRMVRAMDMLENPHLSVPSVLVAGTNGKGAVCHMTDAILSSFGLNRVLYTSPHLRSVTERVLIDSREVSRELLGAHIERVWDLTEKRGLERLTYFETATAACFSLLPKVGADLLISEVGLGGRWDATNILEPQACAITSISLDHTDLLGEDVVSIASEKAGIIKPSTPLVLGPLLGCGDDRIRCLRTTMDVCSRNGSPVVLICREGETEAMSEVLEEASVPDWRLVAVGCKTTRDGTISRMNVVQNPDRQNAEPRLRLLDLTLNGTFRTPLLGDHQSFNSAIALSLSLLVLPSALARSRLNRRLDVPFEVLVEGCVESVEQEFDCTYLTKLLTDGLARTSLMGRMERRTHKGGTFYLDGGHNVEAGASISTTIKELHPGNKAVLLFSMMRDKDVVNYLRNFRGLVSEVVLAQLPMKRATPLQELTEAIRTTLGNDIMVRSFEETDRAVEAFLDSTGRNGLGLVCGTFYLYDVVIRALED